MERGEAESFAVATLADGCKKLQQLMLPRCLASVGGLHALFHGGSQLERLELPHCCYLSDPLIEALADRCGRVARGVWGGEGGRGVVTRGLAPPPPTPLPPPAVSEVPCSKSTLVLF